MHTAHNLTMQIAPLRIQSQQFHLRQHPPTVLVLHYTVLDLAESKRVLTQGPVSVHWLLATDGTAFQVLDDRTEVGYHAGLSSWRGLTQINEHSVGIEVVQTDGNRLPYPEVQVQALTALCQDILRRHPTIRAVDVVGHSDIAPHRKIDPGKLFPWQRLAENGIGLWPSDAPAYEGPADEASLLALLRRCGYPGPHHYALLEGKNRYVSATEPLPEGTVRNAVMLADIVAAFQRRYCPDRVTGVADARTKAMLAAVAKLQTGSS